VAGYPRHPDPPHNQILPITRSSLVNATDEVTEAGGVTAGQPGRRMFPIDSAQRFSESNNAWRKDL